MIATSLRFKKNELKLLLREHWMQLILKEASGIAGVTQPPSLKSNKIVDQFAKDIKDPAWETMKGIGSFFANPPSMISSSIFGFGGNLGFDAENQLEFTKHWRETLGSLGGDLAQKIPVVGKYFGAGLDNAAEMATAMFFDPRSRGRRIRVSQKQPTQPTAPRLPDSVRAASGEFRNPRPEFKD